MRAIVVSCVYPPEPVISGRTSADIAKGLSERGHAVTVVTGFPSRPAGRLYRGFSRHLFQWSKGEPGIALLRCFGTVSTQSSLLSRCLENLSFGVSSSLAVLTLPRADVIYSNSWPILATGLTCLVALVRRIPLVLSVQDLYPESLLSQARVRKGGWLVRAFRWADGRIARSSHYLIVISERFAETYRTTRGVSPDRLLVVPNWGDHQAWNTDGEEEREFRARKKIPAEAFVFAYGGNIGVAAGVERLIEAFATVTGRPSARLLIAGDGSQLDACRKAAERTADPRIMFHSPWPIEETGAVLRSAQVLVLPTRGPQSAASVPSKLISYWLSGRPVLAQALPESELAELIERAGGGWTVEPDRPDRLAERIEEILRLSAEQIRVRGEAGRVFAERHLTRDACLPRVIRLLEKAASGDLQERQST
jgi:glycosyltransferase involved in cell wall biosynthesis